MLTVVLYGGTDDMKVKVQHEAGMAKAKDKINVDVDVNAEKLIDKALDRVDKKREREAPTPGHEKHVEMDAGVLLKCPKCGADLGSFVINCPSCGYELRGAKPSVAIQQFSRHLSSLEVKAGGGLATKLKPKTLSKSEIKVINYIKNYTVPNSKEDIFEFMIFAMSKIDQDALFKDVEGGQQTGHEDYYKKEINNAWTAKINQVYAKAKLSFGSDPEFPKIEEIYSGKGSAIESVKKKSRNKKIMSVLTLIIIGVLCVGYFAGMGIKHSIKEHNLESTVQEIQIDMENNDYDSAMMKANTLHMDDGWSDESEQHWDKQREDLIQMIKDAQDE